MYTLFLMLDANFRAKSKNRGLSDFDIAPGWSYFVEEERYVHYINSQGDQTEVMCPTFPLNRRPGRYSDTYRPSRILALPSTKRSSTQIFGKKGISRRA